MGLEDFWPLRGLVCGVFFPPNPVLLDRSLVVAAVVFTRGTFRPLFCISIQLSILSFLYE